MAETSDVEIDWPVPSRWWCAKPRCGDWEDVMSHYSDDDRDTGFSWFEDAVTLMFAILGSIFARFWREIKR